MSVRRILTVQDISCVGQCSMTVALPVLSACGHETCVLPTLLLSTHTGGFGTPEIVRFSDRLEPIIAHWRKTTSPLMPFSPATWEAFRPSTQRRKS